MRTPKTCLIAFLTLFVSFCTAQTLQINYQMSYITDTLSQQENRREMVLLIENDNYVFADEYLFINAANQNETPADLQFYVQRKSDRILKFHRIDGNNFYVEQESPIMEWTVLPDVKTVEGLVCQKAELYYKGRFWNAWFTTAYPISYGPYLFGGLPGIILELSDSKNHYKFTATKISRQISEIHSITGTKVTEKQLNKLYLDHYDNPFRKMKEMGITEVYDESGNRMPLPNFDKMKTERQQFLKKNNNPIELDDALQYPDK